MSPSRQFKILIVDDSMFIGAKISELLLSIPYVVLLPQATSVPEALASCKSNKPDILCVDYNLASGGNGLQIVKAIKKDQSQIKIIMLTNSSSKFYSNKFKEYGGDIFLDKTTEFVKIVDVVNSLIASL